MPVSAKIFLHQETIPLEEIAEKLEGWREEETFEVPGENYSLLANIEEVEYDDEELSGIYRYDSVAMHTWRGVIAATPYTTSAPFVFTEQDDQKFLIVLAPKSTSNKVANQLSMILHGVQGAIVEPMIRSALFEEFQEGTETTKIMLFEDIDIPNIDKATLYGGDGGNVQQTNLYGNFIAHGRPSYMVAKTKKRGWTVGIVRDCTIVVFNTVMKSAFIEFIKEEILPMTLRRNRD
ncbi:hypothetical protein LCGC14_1524770 [marine sediment metagenome]|uniref:Uncharacterized protein n=1 Tax=marine sediment metagenome TaxID=412755 RepID=A0A0F9LD25_9ZZZZ